MASFRYSLGDRVPDACRGGAVSLGNFDGVHRGHQALLAETVRLGRPAVAVTFDPPPAQLLRPQAVGPLLTPVDYRCELLQVAGADHVVVVKTTPELLQLSAREFFDRILLTGFGAKAIVEGFNFAFGKDRAGTGEILKQWGQAAAMTVTLLEAQLIEGQTISSSRVRSALLAGDVVAAGQLLGRPYRLFGTIGEGNRRGRTLGFPTANLTTLDNLAPGPGVYAALVPFEGTSYQAAAHIGPRPTFGDPRPSVEIHLLDFTGDLYGKALAADLIAKVREPRSFASPAELIDQIQRDIADVKNALRA